MWGTNLEV